MLSRFFIYSHDGINYSVNYRKLNACEVVLLEEKGDKYSSKTIRQAVQFLRSRFKSIKKIRYDSSLPNIVLGHPCAWYMGET
jgi:hypothetical protein